MRLIDADAVDDVIQTLNENGWHITRDEYKRTDRILFEIPTVDAVKVVRCKDCKFGSPNGKYGCKCYHYKLYETHEMSPNDFCSWGERKEDEVN